MTLKSPFGELSLRVYFFNFFFNKQYQDYHRLLNSFAEKLFNMQLDIRLTPCPSQKVILKIEQNLIIYHFRSVPYSIVLFCSLRLLVKTFEEKIKLVSKRSHVTYAPRIFH